MPSLGLESHVNTGKGTVQLSFDLPTRCLNSKAYPIKSPNGSNIIIYGHNYGLRILWRGGHFESKTKNGSLNEQPQENTDNAVLQDLDLNLGCAVSSLAVPKPPLDMSTFASDFYPQILSQKIVIAVGCSDNSVRVVSLPLLPPTPDLKQRVEKSKAGAISIDGSGKFGEQIILVNTHHEPPEVALTFTPQSSIDPDVQDLAPTPARPNRGQIESTRGWNLIVASVSREVTGLVTFVQLPLVSKKAGSKTEYRVSADQIDVYHKEYLKSPAVAISFNPASSSSPSHLYLLVSDKRGAVSVFDCYSNTWLASFFVGFDPQQAGSRKHILDAQWCLSGAGILVLLSDGEWGLWDLTSRDTGLVKGAFLTQWTRSGWTKKEQKPRLSGISLASGFVPMTPGSRRRQEESLFASSSKKAKTSSHGIITIVRLPSKPESAVIYYDSSVVLITRLFDNDNFEVTPLDVKTFGETITSIDSSQSFSKSAGRLGSELTISTEHRLIFLNDALPKLEKEKTDAMNIDSDTLDVSAIDRLLGEMESRDEQRFRTTRRKVGFVSPK